MIALSILVVLSIWTSRNQECEAFSITTTTSNQIRTLESLGSKQARGASLSSALFSSTQKGDEIHNDSMLTSTSTLTTSKEAHALEIFERHSSDGEYEGQKFISKPSSLLGVLEDLDLDATLEDAEIVFRFLDSDGDGRLLFKDEFLPWYLDAVQQATEISRVFQSMLVGRRTVNEFDKTPVDDAILNRAIQCAIAAPNRSLSEPWRFLSLGSSTIEKLAALNTKQTKADAEEGKFTKFADWSNIAPGWCVVTMQLTGDDNEEITDIDEYLMPVVEQEDYKSVCCAVQNFMLSMWSEGIGTKWTTGPVQTTSEFSEICGIDRSKERVVGIIWYGYATNGTKHADPRRRKLSVNDVLRYLP